MWSGVSIESVRESIYGNFYSEHDYNIINGDIDNLTLKDVKRLINKARKIGDTLTEISLVEMYDELLYVPPAKRPPLSPREELLAEMRRLIAEAESKYLRT